MGEGKDNFGAVNTVNFLQVFLRPNKKQVCWNLYKANIGQRLVQEYILDKLLVHHSLQLV